MWLHSYTNNAINVNRQSGDLPLALTFQIYSLMTTI